MPLSTWIRRPELNCNTGKLDSEFASDRTQYSSCIVHEVDMVGGRAVARATLTMFFGGESLMKPLHVWHGADFLDRFRPRARYQTPDFGVVSTSFSANQAQIPDLRPRRDLIQCFSSLDVMAKLTKDTKLKVGFTRLLDAMILLI